MRRSAVAAAGVAFLVAAALGSPAGASVAPPTSASGEPTRVPVGKIDVSYLSSGAKAFFLGPQAAGDPGPAGLAGPSLGSNVDANDPQQDLAAGQSESAIAAAGHRVMVAWNDATGFIVRPSTVRRASLTGVAFSADGGRSFRDLLGLPNNRPGQQWSGDPSVVAVDGGRHFIVSSLYVPANLGACDETGPQRFRLAVAVATVGAGNAVSFSQPVVAADGGDGCKLFRPPKKVPPNLAFLDKPFLAYDGETRTLSMSYTRFYLGFGGQSGTGQIELVRAHVPAEPRQLTGRNFRQPVVVWPEEPTVANQGSYPAVARNGDTYVAWERNAFSNLFNGDPYVYINAARVRAGASTPSVGGPGDPRVVSRGQVNSSPKGGVKSLGNVAIAGYNRGLGQDFPRIAVNGPRHQVVVAWNDASRHPLGDIWLRSLPLGLDIGGPISKVNDDNSYALHFLPALSVRSDGSIVTSWYDRRRGGADSATTDYYGEVRTGAARNGTDFRITTGSTNWTNTSTLSSPNFGDYTDNASTGTTTYFTWSDGRLGVPQPFVDSH